MKGESILEHQKETVLTMLRLGRNSKEEGAPKVVTWKVLVYDRFCRDILAPLLSVSDLRREGVTLHMLLHSDRQQIPDVEAIYFVQPTKTNVERIVQDIGQSDPLYNRFHIYSCGSMDRSLLEMFASGCLTSRSSQVACIRDSYLDFCCPFPNVFSQMWDGSFHAIHNPLLQESELNRMIRSCVGSVASVCATLGVLPVIYAQRGKASEMLAKMLWEFFRTSAAFRPLVATAPQTERPVLLLVDRTSDMASPLCHPWVYGAMLHDILNMRLGRVHVDSPADEKEKGKKSSRVRYELDWNTDSFWRDYSGSSFDIVASEVESAVEAYKKEMEDIRKKTGIAVSDMDGDDEEQEEVNNPLTNTEGLASTISSLPELRQKKKTIDMHTSIACAILDQIKERQLDVYSALEESLLSHLPVDSKTLRSLLLPPENDEETKVNGVSNYDRARLFLVHYLTYRGGKLKESEMKEFESALMDEGIDISSLSFLKKQCTYSSESNAFTSSLSSSGEGSSSVLSDLAGKAKQHIRVFGKQIKVFASGWKRGGSVILPLAHVTQEVLKGELPEDLIVVDPRVATGGGVVPILTKRPVSELVIFVVGGASLLEYFNVDDNARAISENVKISYGGTELLSGLGFLNQLSELGK